MFAHIERMTIRRPRVVLHERRAFFHQLKSVSLRLLEGHDCRWEMVLDQISQFLRESADSR